MSEPAEKQWKPPFCANWAAELTCPKCGKNSVHVRERETYWDGTDYEAYCGECETLLTVYASVEIVFSDVEVAE